MADGDSESGAGDIEGAHLQAAVPFVIELLIRRRVGQLKGLQGADYVVRADHVRLAGKDSLGQEIVDLSV